MICTAENNLRSSTEFLQSIIDNVITKIWLVLGLEGWLAVLSKDLNSDPSTHIESYNILVAPDLGSNTFFWPQELPGTQCTNIHDAGKILIAQK